MSGVYTVVCNHKGKPHEMLFYPAGYGAAYDGYVTSIQQLEKELQGAFGSGGNLVYITDDGTRKDIADDHDLDASVENLSNGTVLAVTLVGGKKQGKGNKGKKGKKGKNKNKQTQSDSDSDEEEDSKSEDESSSDDAPAKKNNENNKKGGGSGENRDEKIMERFVYNYADCYHCEMHNWWGARYVYRANPYYSIRGGCYARLDGNDKKQWELSNPWDDIVPDAPLAREDGVPIREGVRQLQYILTVLGLMKLEDTGQFTGSYQYHTEMAVQAFRNKHNVKGGNSKTYDENMRKKLREIVNKARKDGNKML